MKTHELIEQYVYNIDRANRILKDASLHRENVKVKFLQNLDLIPMDTIQLTVPPTKYPHIQSGTYVIVEMNMTVTGDCVYLRIRDMETMEYDIHIPVKSLERMVKVIRRDI